MKRKSGEEADGKEKLGQRGANPRIGRMMLAPEKGAKVRKKGGGGGGIRKQEGGDLGGVA